MDNSHRRIYLDACFDLFHYGHANVLRQAKKLGYTVVAGVHSDKCVGENKGQPVLEERERYDIVRSIRWVDEVIEDAPFSTTVETLDYYNCDVLGHGDDVSISALTGLDCHLEVKARNRFRVLKRTAGVSTTGIMERILCRVIGSTPPEPTSLVTSQLVAAFSPGLTPRAGQTVVYVAGEYDIMHMGHVNYLKQVREHGDFLIVGLYTDQDIHRYRGYVPIMSLQERGLCLLACKYVDEVVMGVSVTVTEELLDSLKVDVVCRDAGEPFGKLDTYKAAEKRCILKDLVRLDPTSTDDVIRRVEENSVELSERNERKAVLMEIGKLQNTQTCQTDTR